jgi:hypothetical protein
MKRGKGYGSELKEWIKCHVKPARDINAYLSVEFNIKEKIKSLDDFIYYIIKSHLKYLLKA